MTRRGSRAGGNAVMHNTAFQRCGRVQSSARGQYMRRREFITLLGSAAVAWPLHARAQQSLPAVGFLHVAFPDPYKEQLAAFRHGLKQSGHVEGRDVAIDFRWA